MIYAHYIVASRYGDEWRVDAAMSGDETIRKRAIAWANSAKDDAVHGPATIVIEFKNADAADVAALYRSKYLSNGEVDIFKRYGMIIALIEETK